MIKVDNFFTNKDVVAVAVSGGKDSMALLHVLYNALPKQNLKAINVEHGIRGEESKQDSLFVKEQCEKLGIELKCFSADCVAFSKANNTSLEEGARIVRYKFFEEAVNSGFCQFVATAHHLSDSVETILFNLFRGSGVSGVSGIENRDYIIRPFLNVTREEIDLYVQKHNISYVEDSTNSDLTYTRNYIRKEIIPSIKQRFPEAIKAIGRFAKISSIQEDFILQQAKKELEIKGDEISFKIDLPKAIKYKCTILALQALGVEKDYEFRHCLEVDKLDERKNGDVIFFPKNVKCVKDYGKITFYKEKSNLVEQTPFSLGEITLLDKTIFITKNQEKGFLKFDLNKLPKDCVVRTRQEGDEFTPYKNNSKKLKKYLIDKKIPKRKRDELLLIASGKEVFVVIGEEISDKIKVEETSNVYYVGIKGDKNGN